MWGGHSVYVRHEYGSVSRGGGGTVYMSDTSTALEVVMWGGGGGGHSVYVRHEYGSVSSYVGGGWAQCIC